MREIPFFNYRHIYLSNREAFQKIFDDVGSRGAFILQEELERFEQELAEYVGVKHAIGVGNATDGLFLLYLAAGVSAGDEVLFCSHTMTATVAHLPILSAIPIPVEVGPDWMMDARLLREKISDKTRFIVPTQVNGRVADMDSICLIAEEFDLQVIEDSAQALGARFKGTCAGTFGVGGVLSFYPAKSLGCLGDGGAVLTNSSEVNEQVRLLRDHGRASIAETQCWGYNSRLDNLQAAFLSFLLKQFDSVISRRREIAERYHERLSQIDTIRVPPPPDNGDHFDTFQNYEIAASDRAALRAWLREKGIGTIMQWGGKAVHQIEGLKLSASLPYTEQFFKECFLLPLNMSIRDDEIDYVCDMIEKYYSMKKQ